MWRFSLLAAGGVLLSLLAQGCVADQHAKAEKLLAAGRYEEVLALLPERSDSASCLLRGEALLAQSKYARASDEFGAGFTQPGMDSTTYGTKVVDAYLTEFIRIVSTKELERTEQTLSLMQFAGGTADALGAHDYFVAGLQRAVSDAAQAYDNPLAQRLERNLQVAKRRGAVRRVMADLRSIGTAIESYSVDHDEYPVARSISELAGFLEPAYLKVVPRTDASAHDFVVRSQRDMYSLCAANGEKQGCDVLFSTGSFNGVGEAIVFSDGRFVRLPAEMEENQSYR